MTLKYVNQVEDALNYIQSEVDILRNKLSIEVPTSQKLTDYKNVYEKYPILRYELSRITSIGTYDSTFYNKDHNAMADTVQKVKARQTALLENINDLTNFADKTHELNLVIIQHNKKIHDNVKSIMRTVGIPDTYKTIDTKSRSRTTKYINNTAGYILDLQRSVPINDAQYINLKTHISNKTASINKWAENAIKFISDIEVIRIEEDTKKKKEQFLATMRVKYKLDYQADEKNVYSAIIKANKWVYLLHASIRQVTDIIHYDKSYIPNFKDEDQVILDCLNQNNHDWKKTAETFKTEFNIDTDDFIAYYNLFPN